MRIVVGLNLLVLVVYALKSEKGEQWRKRAEEKLKLIAMKERLINSLRKAEEQRTSILHAVPAWTGVLSVSTREPPAPNGVPMFATFNKKKGNR